MVYDLWWLSIKEQRDLRSVEIMDVPRREEAM